MAKGILGKKAGMTTVFSEEGKAIPVTVVEVNPNVVLQEKTVAIDGYNSLKLSVEDKKINKAIKAEIGEAKKAKTSPKYFIREIRTMAGYSLGDKITVSIFSSGMLVDVTGKSKGKGFQGSIKRHNQSRGPMAHGSKYHRGTGSLGDIRSTVKKSKKMPGRMGGSRVTMQNLKVVAVDPVANLILIKGSIPGPNKSFVIIREAIKGNPEKIIPIKMVNVDESKIKNKLFEEGKKVSAQLTSKMSIDQMQVEIAQAKIKHDEEQKERIDLLARAQELKINKTKARKMELKELRKEIAKVEKLVASRAKEKASREK